MKINKLLKITLAITISLIAIITSCKGIDEIANGFDVVVNTSIFKQQVVVEIFDPVDQENLTGSNVLSIEVMGKDADKIVTDAGNEISDAKVVNGIVALAVNPNKNPNTDPVEFLLKIKGDNYLTTTIPVFLSETDSIATFSANIVNKMSTPSGVDYVSKTETLTNNTLSSDITVETSSSASTGTTSEVTVKAGTIFKDENGNAISGGSIKSEVVNFNSNDPEALASFPGSFMPQEITDENGEKVNDAYFETAGFVSIDMQIGNTEVKNFSEPITIKMQVASDYINPETGNAIQLGDVIPIWSYSKDDGKWDYHTDGTVTQDGNGNFVIEYTTTHLSWYNLDFKGRRCNRAATINVTMTGVSRSNAYSLFSDFVYAGTNQPVSPFSGKTKSWYDGQQFRLLRTPSNRNIQMVIYSGRSRYRRGNLIFRSAPFNACSSGSVNIDVSNIIAGLPQLVNVTVRYRGVCGSRTIEPTIPLWIKDPTYNYWRYLGYVYRGSIIIRQIELNKPYEFRTYYNGNYFVQSLTFNSTELINDSYQVPAELCNLLF